MESGAMANQEPTCPYEFSMIGRRDGQSSFRPFR